MATNYMFRYYGGSGQLVGSYVPIGYGSIPKYIELQLSHIPDTVGRLVTLAYWICDKNFDITELEMDATKNNGPRYCTTIDTSKALVHEIKYTGEELSIPHVSTDTIPDDGIDTCRFNFNQDNDGIKASKIFVALISTKDNGFDYDYNSATLRVCADYGSVYIKDDIYSDNIRVDNDGGLYISGSLFENPDGSSSDSEESSNLKPAKIQCSDLRYRTWSDPDGPFAIQNSSFGDKYTIAFADGGHSHSDVNDFNTLNYTYRGSSGIIKTHIKNSNNNFETDFCIPEGRLKDVVFAYPEREAYDFEVSNRTGASEGRWVFKRSRIKFTIPPAMKNGRAIDKGITLRYKVITSLFDKTIYTSEYKIKKYSAEEAAKNIELVICPRDEGVLDNMEFTVLLSRKYTNASNNQYSTEVAYKFRTYQKPTVNIASPKIIRNSSTGTDFKYSKILTSNMYSNFNGEQSIVNKYVCDALNVMLATPQNDASDIPMFVRFFLAEYKYGRDGRVTNKNANNITEATDPNFDTIQALYKSSNSSKYTTKSEILTGNFTDAAEFKNDTGNEGTYKRTAFLTGIYANDGQPILLSGRFTKNTISSVGQDYKLWTYKDWDFVAENKNNNDKYDELVGNAWQVEGVKHDNAGNIMYDGDNNPIKEMLTPSVVGDHLGAPTKTYWSDGHVKTAEQRVSKNILFRAGYVYLLRVRMFHGAAAGAIAKKIDTINNASLKKKYNIIYGNENSGSYDYTNAIYSSGTVYPDDDSMTYGQLKPYNGWQGPEDGTSGEQLFTGTSSTIGSYNSRLEQTYSGFSEVDYTLIEPVCPYTSKSNLITVHPTSPQISANQWITFNYRHLAKNVGGLDYNSAYYDSSQKKYITNSKVFGKTAGGIQNTLTRIVSMYTSAVETIWNNYNTKISRNAEGFNQIMGNPHTCSESSPTLNYEKVSLWIKPINQREMDNQGDSLQNFTSAYGKTNTNNYPLIFEFGANGRSLSDIANDAFYYPASLCSEFNKYRLQCTPQNKNSYTYDLSSFNYLGAPEWEIIYKRYNGSQTGSATRYLSLNEPMGNVYRWQPVINAMIPNGSSIKEIKIEDNATNKTIAKNYTIGENTLRQNRTFTADTVHLLYAANETDRDYDLQTKYFYTDNHTVNAGEVSLSNNETNRFCIKEFCGSVDGGIYGSGYPVMYTTASNPAGTKYGSNRNIKYFCTALTTNEYPGHIYSRVPSIQDCECGIPTPNNLPNVGNLSSKGSTTINSNENNVVPITRTTHYLYFKTWINTTFCMKVDVSIQANHSCEWEYPPEGDPIHVGHETDTVEKTYWFNGNQLVIDANAMQNAQNKDLLDVYPNSEIKLGNANGLSEVYGEDNKGWGRCLSADDISNRQIKFDGTINSKNTESGGLEVPVMVRYTPLLQPKLLAKTCSNGNKNGNDTTYLSLASSNITLIKCRGKKQWLSSFVDGTLSDDGKYTQVETGQIDLKVAYPYIKETNTYNTVSPNGGNGGNVYFNDYFIDVDTDASKSIDTLTDTDASTNMDFLGGNGICTAYTAILVPSNPKLPDESTFDYKWYFNNTDKHWNFYKQPANYYKLGDIFKNVRSKTVKDCGPVLIGYNLQPLEHPETCGYLDTDYIIKNKIPNNFIDSGYRDESFRGRNFQTISLNFTALRQGKFTAFDNNGTFYNYSQAKSKLGFELTKANILQVGVIYDLVIIPVYSNRTINLLDYNRSGGYGPGTINGEIPGGGNLINEVFSSNTGEVHLAGSNPLVLYNYFQIGLETEKTCSSGGGGGGDVPDPPTPDPEEPDPTYVYDSDSAIVFPNVDNEMFNVEKGQIKEPPGFWLNNSFKLILRMPSFRLKGDEYSDSDLNTIDNASNGQLLTDDGNTADDFEFSDIQIHIGRINELEPYGYPDEQHLNLDKISDKNELAKAHIISYNDYGHMGMGVFSKKLSLYNVVDGKDEDTRELLTGGSLDPNSNDYSHRFIEVNLSNCKIMNESGNLVPIYTLYPEGFYIQFRWKSKYAESQPEEQRWSDWYGGTYDGGRKWWGANGLNYFVPIRNYSTVYTDFRNHIKESYPGAYNTLPKEPIEISNDGIRKIEAIMGKGSIMSNGSVNEESNTYPKNAISPTFYHVGVGNHNASPIVPTNETLNVLESLNSSKYGNIKLSVNNDTSYYNQIQHNVSHDKNGPTSGYSFNNHQNFWEMLYVDYIIRNMCKLYYKPKYNGRDSGCKLNNHLYYHLSTPKGIVLNYLTWGWDDTEYRMFNDSSLISAYKGPGNEKEFTENKSHVNNKLYIYDEKTDSVLADGVRIQGPNNATHSKIKTFSESERKRWNRNKYYRRIITRQDFDELNNHLEELVEFIRHPYFTGLNDNNFDMIGDSVPVSKKELLKSFVKGRAGIIGHDTSRNSGLTAAQTNNNNINHTMVDSNYVQNIWQNILTVCRPSIQTATKQNINLK